MVKGGELHVQMRQFAVDAVGQFYHQWTKPISVQGLLSFCFVALHSNVSPVVVLSLCHALSDWKRILSTTNGQRGIIVNRLHTGMQTEVE